MLGILERNPEHGFALAISPGDAECKMVMGRCILLGHSSRLLLDSFVFKNSRWHGLHTSVSGQVAAAGFPEGKNQ
jgi:hypothetical protein